MKKYLKYILLFLYFSVCLIICYTVFRNDTFVNYGFSYAISRGEIPYRDFNLVVPPLSPLIYSIFLLFNKSILTYYLTQAFFLTVFSYFIFKLLGNKGYLFLLLMMLPFPIAFVSCMYPGYNFLVFFLLIVLIYLEKEKKSDLLIGLIIGFIFCTKQTLGVLVLPNIYFLFKDRKKFGKRALGFLIPVGVMFLYLLITKSLYQFIDLCFLGLFDFNNSNSYVNIFYLIVLIVSIGLVLFKIINNKKNIINYYVLFFVIISIPIIDFYHVSYFTLAVILLFLMDFKLKRNIVKQSILFMVSISSIWMFIQVKYIDNFTISSLHNFPFLVASNDYFKFIKEVDDYTKTLDKKVIYLVRGTEDYLFKIMNDKDITYFDLPNYGNYGYNGVEKILNKLKKEKGYFILDSKLYKENPPTQQYVVELSTYIRDHGKMVKKIGSFEIFLKE